jgi:hypothetical protein
MKLSEENIGQTLQDTGTDNDFLDRIPKVQETKAKMDKRNYIKLKRFAQK